MAQRVCIAGQQRSQPATLQSYFHAVSYKTNLSIGHSTYRSFRDKMRRRASKGTTPRRRLHPLTSQSTNNSTSLTGLGRLSAEIEALASRR